MARRYLVPAVEALPNLARFAPALTPRAMTVLQSVGPKPPQIKRALVQHLYNDLGVLVYAGANVEQVNRIGDLLGKTVAGGGLQRLASSARLGFDKMVIMKMPTEEWHVDKEYRTEDGFLSSQGLLDLGLRAGQQWKDEALSALRETQPVFQSASLKAFDVSLLQEGEQASGIAHQTINSRRLLPVDAYVFSGRDFDVGKVNLDGGKFNLLVKFYTVVTGKYVGSVTLTMVPFTTTNGVKTRMSADEVNQVWRCVPTIVKGTQPNPVFHRVAIGTISLEDEIWWGRMSDETRSKLMAERAEETARRAEREEQVKRDRAKKIEAIRALNLKQKQRRRSEKDKAAAAEAKASATEDKAQHEP